MVRRDEPAVGSDATVAPDARVELSWLALPKWFLMALGGLAVASLVYPGDDKWAAFATLGVAVLVSALAESKVQLTLEGDTFTVRSLFRGPKRLTRGQIAGYFVERASTRGQAERVVVVGRSRDAGRPALTIELGGSTPRRAERRLTEVTDALRDWGVPPLQAPSGD